MPFFAPYGENSFNYRTPTPENATFWGICSKEKTLDELIVLPCMCDEENKHAETSSLDLN